MTNLNLNDEWNFITTEIHKEKPNEKNLLKRELLFTLELALSRISSSKIDEHFYKELKEKYQRTH